MTSDEVEWRDCSLHAVTSPVIYCSTLIIRNLILLYIVLYNKNSNGLLKDFGGMKKENKI